MGYRKEEDLLGTLILFSLSQAQNIINQDFLLMGYNDRILLWEDLIIYLSLEKLSSHYRFTRLIINRLSKKVGTQRYYTTSALQTEVAILRV